MDANGYSQEEKVFNLQLIVQKLEEELLLYRNGTTATELLELIHEKDVEIETWRAKCDEKDEKMKKIAKTSGDVLLKFERLTEDFSSQEKEKLMLHDHIHRLEDEMRSMASNITQLHETIDQMKREAQAKDDMIGQLRLQVWEMQQHSTRLEEKDEIFKQEIEQVKEEADRSQTMLKDIISSLEAKLQDMEKSVLMKTLEIESTNKEISRWKGYVEEQDKSIDKLQKRCATLVAEKGDKLKSLDQERQEMIAHVQQFRESMSTNLQQREDALKRKDEKIREVRHFLYLVLSSSSITFASLQLILQNATLQQQIRLQKMQEGNNEIRQMQQNAENATNIVLQKLSSKDKKKNVPLTDHTNTAPAVPTSNGI